MGQMVVESWASARSFSVEMAIARMASKSLRDGGMVEGSEKGT
jgi:hypothetical protein